jgi:hypothetical protein
VADVTALVVEHRCRADAVYPARDPYVERYWLPTLGPSAIMLLRRLALDALAEPATTYDVECLARSLGLHGPALERVLRRLAQFGFACLLADGRWSVDVMLPAVHPKHVRRLPEPLAAELAS